MLVVEYTLIVYISSRGIAPPENRSLTVVESLLLNERCLEGNLNRQAIFRGYNSLDTVYIYDAIFYTKNVREYIWFGHKLATKK